MTSSVVAVGIVVLGTLYGCGTDTASSDTSLPTTSSTAAPRVVVYAEGNGTKSAAVTLLTETGGTIQKDVSLPMGNPGTGQQGVESTLFKHGAPLYISVQNKEAAGSVTCRIGRRPEDRRSHLERRLRDRELPGDGPVMGQVQACK
jgi:hypothetical protein